MIHPTAIINENVSIEPDVEIGPYSIVHSGVKIGSGTKIGSHCEIGVETELAKSKELNIGKNSIILLFNNASPYHLHSFPYCLITSEIVIPFSSSIAESHSQTFLSHMNGDGPKS